jgi:hypothetical protein
MATAEDRAINAILQRRATGRICEHLKIDGGTAVVIEGNTVKLCDACRRKLCTCERCSAFVPQEGYGGGNCHRDPPRVFSPGPELSDWACESPYVMADQCFRDCWRQDRPWTLDEVLAILRPDDVDDEALGACERCGKYHLGSQRPVGESMAADAAAEAPDGWQEEGP